MEKDISNEQHDNMNKLHWVQRPPKIKAYVLTLVYTEVYSFPVCFGSKGKLNQLYLKFPIIFYDLLYTVACNWMQEKAHFL